MENIKKDLFYPSILSKGFEKSIERIHNEFVDGFSFISGMKKAVAIFGSGRFPENNPHYQEARKLADLLAKEAFATVTGGGPGIMEAANQGASEAGGQSIGLNIEIPQGQEYNKYVKQGIKFNHFFVRKVMFAAACSCYVFFPGGFGTLDEFFEIVNIIHNKKIHKKPLLIMVGKDYWQPLLNWLKTEVYGKHKAIDQADFDILNLADSAEETFEMIKNHAA